MKFKTEPNTTFQSFDLIISVQTANECVALRNLFATDDDTFKGEFDRISSELDQKLEGS